MATTNTTTTMKAIRSNPKTGKFTMQDVPAPTSPRYADWIVLKTAFAAACSTDLLIYTGQFPTPPNLIPGHRFCGVISTVGSDVRSCKVGDRVAVNPSGHCGDCKFCKRGKINHCVTGGLRSIIGMAQNGGFAEYVDLPANQVEVLPSGMPLRQAVLCEPLSCLLHTQQLCQDFPSDTNILIMGAGVVGLLWASHLNRRGYRNVTQTEPIPKRRTYAANLNPKYTIHSPEELTKVMSGVYSDVDGFEVVIDTTGNPEAFSQAFPMLARGATYMLFGVGAMDATDDLPLTDVVMKEIRIQGSIINPSTLPEAVHVMKDLHEEKFVSFDTLGMRSFALKDYEKAFDLLASMDVTQVVFEIGGEM